MGFKKKTSKKTAAKKRGGSRYAGVKAGQPRDPILHQGTYIIEALGMEEDDPNGTTYHKAKVRVVEVLEGAEDSDKAGDECVILSRVSGKFCDSGIRDVKNMTLMMSGFDYSEEEEYDELDPDGEFMDACIGEANDFSREDGKCPLFGRRAKVRVTRGNDVLDKEGKPTGDYYREYRWECIDEDDQEVPSPFDDGEGEEE
jgi:hypothetical protein